MFFSRPIIKRFCHSHGRSKCYENIHKIDSLRREVNEIKELINQYQEPFIVIYGSCVFSLAGIIGLVLTK